VSSSITSDQYYVRYPTCNANGKAPEELWWMDVEMPDLQA